MNQETIPRSLLESFILTVRRDLASASRWLEPASVVPAEKILAELEAILTDPQHRWISVADAARVTSKSEETIRRWCRNKTAPFRFRKRNSGEYEIWLPDLNRGEHETHAA